MFELSTSWVSTINCLVSNCHLNKNADRMKLNISKLMEPNKISDKNSVANKMKVVSYNDVPSDMIHEMVIA